MDDVISSLAQQQVDIAFLSETKRKGQGNENRNNYVHFWSGVNKGKRAKAGVSILIKKQLMKHVTNYEYISERIMKIQINLYGRETVLIATYAPTDDSAINIKENYYEQLAEQLDKVKNYQEVILAGDLNGRVGSKVDDTVVGPFGEEITNESGERLINMCETYKLKITNTFFCHKNIHR